MVKKKPKYSARQEVLYYWPLKQNYFKAFVLKQIENNDNEVNYHIRVLNYQNNSNWTLTVKESALSPLENPNEIMKELCNV